jgi:Asp/Glu/hydantoin racemase
LNTCSSVGDVVEHAQWFIPVPIFRIDKPMAEKAVIAGNRIGVLATLPTTLAPTVRLVASTAAAIQRGVEIVEGLAEGAFAALVSGHPDKHDDILLETARLVSDSVDVIVLAQGSMARMEKKIGEATGKPVFSSPESGVLAIKDFLSADRLHAKG